jgi:predicted glutamine amidotransferase
MCEICILDPREYSAEDTVAAAFSLYERMRDGLGVVYLREDESRTSFKYDVYKSVAPEREEVRGFIEANQDGALRCMMHGRLATHGDANQQNTHPLEIECEECSVEYVIHNGVVYDFLQRRHRLRTAGHDITTDVDSEVIGHTHGETPSSFDDDSHGIHLYEEQPAYILLEEDAVFVHGGRGYHLTERAKMARSSRSFAPSSREDDYNKVILTPTNAE